MAIPEETPGNAHGTVVTAKVKSPKEVDNDAAKQICVQDAEFAESWLTSRYWSLRWLEADILYQSPPGVATWENTTIPMSNISKFTVATHVNALKSKAIEGLFYDEPPFLLQPRPNTNQMAVRAITAVQGAQLDESEFREEVDLGFFSAFLFGTGIWKWGWKQVSDVRKKYVRKQQPTTIDMPASGHTITVPTSASDEFEVQEFETLTCYPWLENVDIRYVLVDPGCRRPDIRKAKYVIHKLDMTYKDLLELKEDPFANYDLPSEAEIKSWFEPPMTPTGEVGNLAEQYSQNLGTNYIMHAAPRFQKTTNDPLDEPLEVLERVDDDKIITLVNRTKVIRNEENPFHKINYYSVNWWNNQDCFWGNGLGRVLGGDQRFQQGLINACADVTTLALHPTYLRAKGANVPTQQIRQRIGGIIDVDIKPEAGVRSVKDAFMILEQPRIPPEAFAQEQASEARTEQISGANEMLSMGSMPDKGRTSLGRTATGAGGLMAAVNSRIGGFIEDFNRQVYQPWLWQMHELNCERLPVSVLRRMLDEELGSAFKIDEQQYFGAEIESFDVLAGSHLVAKQQMAQSMGFIVQLFDNPATLQQLAQINGEYVDISELLHRMFDMSGSRDYRSIVKKMTPEMQQRMMAQNPAVIKAQSATALQQQKDENKAALNTDDNMAKAVRDVLRQIIEKGISTEAITGAPGGPGIGSVTES